MVDGVVVRFEVERGTGTITLDSPGNRNALSRQLRGELAEALAAAAADDAVRVVVLSHAGPVFCAGVDLKEARGSGASDQGVQGLPGILAALAGSAKPVIARLAGPARAGGVGLVAACDLAIAAESVTFAFTEVRLGVVPAVISGVVLPRVLPSAARELFLTGEAFDARRAVEIGLLTRAVPAEQLDAEVGRYAGLLSLGGPAALAATKELLAGNRGKDLAGRLTALAELSSAHFASAEGQEGMRAFAGKRLPSWVTSQP